MVTNVNNNDPIIQETIELIKALGLPIQQQNDRSALCLLALLDLSPGKAWSMAECPMIGITPIMKWAERHYNKEYAPNSRETFRRFSMHQFVQAGLVIYNPDKPTRAINSPDTVYQIEPGVLELIRTYGSDEWEQKLSIFHASHETLVAKYAKEREQTLVPVKIPDGEKIELSPGEHSELIREIIENFAPRFAPGSDPVYVGDTGDKWGFYNAELLESLGIEIDSHGKMPDVVLYFEERNWLFLVESVTSHGPVDGKRHVELERIFLESCADLVYVTAFPNRAVMSRYLGEIAWETEVWVADSPSHLIHFNGEKFLGPHDPNGND